MGRPPVLRVQLSALPGHHVLASGQTLLVTDARGAFRGRDFEGFYADNTRLLSVQELRAGGQLVTAFAASPTGPRNLLAYLEVPPIDGVPPSSVFVELEHVLGDRLRTQLRVRSYTRQPVGFELTLRLAADFVDTSELKGGRRQQQAEAKIDWDEGRRELRFDYLHPELDRACVVRVDQAPDAPRFDGDELRFDLNLPPRGQADIRLVAVPVFDGREGLPSSGVGARSPAVDDVQEQLASEAVQLATPNHTVARAWQSAVDDLCALPLGLPSGPAAPAAGLPGYQYLFARDVLTTAWQAAMALPRMMPDSLQVLAAFQGQVIDDWRDEEPGKFVHQARNGPVSALGKDPFLCYYGDYAAPSDFLILLGQYLAWTGDLDTTRRLLPAARKAVHWLERYGDLDGDGFLEYVTRSTKGVKHQGWKDSPDAIVDEHGEFVDNPVATCELQAYWYTGLRQAAFVFLLAGDRVFAARLLRDAAELRRRFDEAFWLPDEGFYALALGPDKRPIRSVSSNAGHLLATGIVPPNKAPAVVNTLMSDEMFSGWGVRTLSAEHLAYNPFSYHRGSVWPVENATFALGFARYGQFDALHHLAEGNFAATDLFVRNRLPESLGGLPRGPDHPHPGIYPQSNEPQAWSASAIILLVQALLGLRPLAPLGLLLVDPHLPPWLPELRLEGLRVGNATIDLEFHRAGQRTSFAVTRRQGRLRVLRQPPPQAPGRNPLKKPIHALELIFE